MITRLRAGWVVVALVFGCGGAERPSPDGPDGGSMRSGGHDASTSDRETGSAADAPPSPDAHTLGPAADGGGQSVACVPDAGPFAMSPVRYPACTFADTTACNGDGDCGCGCACQCGVCNCNAAGAVSACASGGTCCTTATDCGPSCYGLTCEQGQCVTASPSEWAGTWEGTFSAPEKDYVGKCGDGLVSDGGGFGSGRYHVVVIAALPNLSVQVVGAMEEVGRPEDGGGFSMTMVEQLCMLPFLVSGSTATLVPGSTCISSMSGACGDSTVRLDTYLRGSATLAAGVMTLTFEDVQALPFDGNSMGTGCAPDGNQVSVRSFSATLEKADAG